MKASTFSLGLLPLLLVPVAIACSGSDEQPLPDAGAGTADASATDASATDAGKTDSAADATADAARPAATFVAAADYANYLIIAPTFPYGVTQIHAAAGPVSGAYWGKHGGPAVATGVYAASNPAPPKLTRYSFPATATGDATKVEKQLGAITGLPADGKYYWGSEAVDTLTGKILVSYTTSASGVPGEALLYGATGDTVEARANVNGYFSGNFFASGGKNFVAYAGLSPLASAASATKANGLYVAEACGAALAPTGTCKPAVLALAWAGNSGPVTFDSRGNLFVAASLAASSELYGLTADTASKATATLTQAPLAASTIRYAGSFAAAYDRDRTSGYLLFKASEFDGAKPADAYEYSAQANHVTTSATLTSALTPGSATAEFTLFADDDGDLWAAVTPKAVDAGAPQPQGVFLELRRKP